MRKTMNQFNMISGDEKIEELVEWIIDSWDMSALEAYVRENLTEYYKNLDNYDDFIANYDNMREIKGFE